MKTKISILIAAVLCLVSCDLDKKPLSQLSPDSFFSTEAELQAFSNNFYDGIFPSTEIYGEQSDLVIKLGLTNEMQSKRTIPESGSGWTWTTLRNFNTLIEYSVNCKDENVRNKYVALARFFRAYFYFEKVKRFGDVPYFDKQLGSDSPELYKPRDSRELVMDKIIEDLDFAATHLSATRDSYRITKWTALALKSRACLFEGTFRKYHAGTSYRMVQRTTHITLTRQSRLQKSSLTSAVILFTQEVEQPTAIETSSPWRMPLLRRSYLQETTISARRATSTTEHTTPSVHMASQV